MEENIRVRYSDKELEEFKALIEEKIKKAQNDLELIKSSYSGPKRLAELLSV